MITEFKIVELTDTKFVHPLKIEYKQNGNQKFWEAVKSFDSVAILLYHKPKESFLLVKQFRPPVYMHDRSHLNTFELCAGILDKNASIEQIAKEEVEEECGFDVKLENIEKINSFYTNVGVSGAKQHLYYAQIDDSMKIGDGGGIHGEEIELLYLPLNEAKEFIYDESKAKTPGLMFSFYWFFENGKDKE